MNNKKIVLHSKETFIVMILGWFVYAYVFIEEFKPNEIIFICYCLCGLVFTYIIIELTKIITIKNNELTSSYFFGLYKESKFDTKKIHKFLIRTNSINQISRITIVFNDGKKIQLHQFQKNFQLAYLFLKNNFPNIENEFQSKYHF